MPAIMRAADLVIFPSRYEPCGLVLLEALASGVPVVTSRNVGGSELIGPEVGIVVEDCDDVDALSHAVGSLLGDGAARAAMGVRARALAETLSWSGTASRYVDLMVQAAHG
jgi:glycosyltransferase involved in cell wall biosynthesis